MCLGVRPAVFLARLLVFFFLTYALWSPFAPLYTQLLATLTGGFLHLTEISRDPNLHRITEMWVKGTGLFFRHRLFPTIVAPGIPAEWVQANLVLLIPLMLATPARSWTQKVVRLALALSIALALQVLDIAVTVKHFYATELQRYSLLYYSDRMRWWYGFGDSFAQSMDTQLFPFVIWAGIHFNQLLGRTPSAPAPPSRAAAAPAAHAPRRKRKAAGK